MTTESTRVPLTRMRRAIAKAMTASALVPQFTIERDASMAALAQWRRAGSASSVGVTYSDALVAAAARALRMHPGINASFAEDAILEHQEVNVGFALDMPEGLIAPAIRSADELSPTRLAAERRRLVEAARDGTLDHQDLLSTTFTVSNLGPLGVVRFRPLVVPPQAAILGAGGLRDGEWVSLSLSCDHRIIDGAPAARFLDDVVGLLEEPAWLEEFE